MAFEMVVMWVLMGLLAGGRAGFIMKSASYGPIGDLILGLVGSVLGSSIFQILGIFPGAGGSRSLWWRSLEPPAYLSPSASYGGRRCGPAEGDPSHPEPGASNRSREGAQKV